MLPLLSAALLALALSATSASAHGCHKGWQQGPEGVHSHGSKCERREGITDQRQKRGKATRRSV